MKKKFLMLLAMVLILTMTACGSRSGTIEGEWVAKISAAPFQDAVVEQMKESEEFAKYADSLDFSEVYLPVSVSFHTDGTMTFGMDEESVTQMGSLLADLLMNIMEQEYAELYPKETMTFEELLETEGLTRSSLQKILAGMLEASLYQSMPEELKEYSLYYRQEGNRIYFSEEKTDFSESPFWVISRKRDLLVVEDKTGGSEAPDGLFPFTLERREPYRK